MQSVPEKASQGPDLPTEYSSISFALRCLAGLFAGIGLLNLSSAIVDRTYESSALEIMINAQALAMEAGVVAVGLSAARNIDRRLVQNGISAGSRTFNVAVTKN